MNCSRFLCTAVLLGQLGACGGDRAAIDPAGSDSAAAPRDPDGPRIPAFVVEDAPAADSTPSIQSVYTSLSEADCRLVERDEETGGTRSRCPGTAGYALMVDDFDARMTVDVVTPGGRTHPLRYPGVVTAAFSSLGPRAEWRMRNGEPIALIVRVNAFENPEVPDRATSYLAVARITPREVCVTDRIPPAADANRAARGAADRSASQPCKPDLADE